MILFLFGISLCLNIVMILIGIKIYNEFVPVFKSKGINIENKKKYDIDNIDFKSFWGDDIDV